MNENPIIEEIRRTRREIEEACGHDWDKLLAYYREVQRKYADRVVSGSPKPLVRERLGKD